MKDFFHKAFTLVEVNIAVGMITVSTLGILALYSLAFREARQSSEDVAMTAYADAVMGQLVNAISATNLKWSVFKTIEASYPPQEGAGKDAKKGWGVYFDFNKDISPKKGFDETAKQAYAKFMAKLQSASKGGAQFNSSWPSGVAGGMKAALVIQHPVREDGTPSPIIRISFRATERDAALLSMPLFFTEARFQGIVDE